MRIVGGRFRGRALTPVGAGDARARLRPTADRVRESLFNLLEHGAAADPVPDARVLDAFAGTGALGLEAVSRGAECAVLLDSGRAAQALIARNIAALDVGDLVRTLRRDATRPGPCPEAPFSVIFLDPPWGQGLGERALTALAAGGWIAPGAVVVWEEAAPQNPPPGWAVIDRRRYGDCWITLLRGPG